MDEKRIQITDENSVILSFCNRDDLYKSIYNDMNTIYKISRSDKDFEVTNDKSVIYGMFNKINGNIIGFCVATYEEQQDKSDHVFVESLCVDPKYIGITKKLLEYSSRFKNISRILCHVYGGILEDGVYNHDRYNRGLSKFYKSLGFNMTNISYDSKQQRFYHMELNMR